jgi:hypothetical protein
MTPDELCGRPSVAGADSPNQFLVRIPHGVNADSDKRAAFGRPFVHD